MYSIAVFRGSGRSQGAGKIGRWTNLDLRKTFGWQLAMKGESLYKTSRLMGSSPEICRRFHAALVPDGFVGDVYFAA
jgi:hypothetical protein